MLRTRWCRVAVASALLLVGLACSTTTAPHRDRAAGSRDGADGQPPDGKWLRDASGQEYYALRVEMPSGSYRWLNEEKTRARIRHGLEVEVLSHDDHGLSIKVYRTDDDAVPPPRRRGSEEAADVAAGDRPAGKEGDGVRLLPLDQGLPRRGQWRNGFGVAT